MLKKCNQVLKRLGDNNAVTFFISLFCVFLLNTIVGIGDYDFVWQTYLGKIIITEHRFDGLKDLIWGTQGLGWYLDHEWLTNVIFYGLNRVFGEMGSVIVFKILMGCLFSISIYFLLREFTDFKNMSWFTYLACITMSFSYATILVKVKAYNISAILMVCLFIVLERYRKKILSFKTFAIWTCIIVLLWNNFHSGSVLLIYGIVGSYWLFCWRDIKTVLLGIGTLGVLCINPFGYNLIKFDITHFFDTVMKKVVTEWGGFDINTSVGKLFIMFLAILFLHILHMSREQENWVYFFLFFVFMIMTFISRRHFLYLYPIAMIVFVKGQFKDLKQWKFKSFIIPTLLIILVTGFIEVTVWQVIPNMERKYMKDYITPELETIIDSTIGDNEGFYDGDLNVWDSGFKSFRTGAFPFTRERNIASYYMENGSTVTIETIINKYGLTKFLCYKYHKSIEDTMTTTHLYDYLITNPKYELLYDDNLLVYFVEK